MHTQTVQFAVEKTKNGQIKTIGKSVIEQPELIFRVALSSGMKTS